MIIGITAARYRSDENDFFKTNSTYIYSLRKLGAAVVMLPYENGIEPLDCIDGLILSGGYDVNPVYYGQRKREETRLVEAEQDAYELSLVHAAIRRYLPVLGICRGEQVINVAFGGTLVQDCHDHYGNLHSVQIKNSSLLKEGCICVNSFHHQKVDKLGDGLKATGVTYDGDIEMIEHIKAPVFGVQWHPEKQYNGSVLEKFTRLCCQRKG